MKKAYVFFGVVIFIMAVGCSNDDLKVYDDLKKSNRVGNELLFALTDFEVHHSEHFESKVDLASYYIAVGDLQRADYYLQRASSVIKNVRRNAEGRNSRALFYGSSAYIALLKSEYDKALTTVTKAINADKNAGADFIFLKAQILFASGKEKEALDFFDANVKRYAEKMNLEDTRVYMYLLAENERFSEADAYVTEYLKSGQYSTGLGLFASNISEKNNKPEEAVLYAFLDYEFSRINTANDSNFLQNLDKIEQLFAESSDIQIQKNVIDAIRSIFDSKIVYQYDLTYDNFVYIYISIKNKIANKTATSTDLKKLLSLENYFRLFSSYYWDIWQLFEMIPAGTKNDAVVCLEKIIYLQPYSIYADNARRVLGSYIGLNVADSKMLLLPKEIEQMINVYAQNKSIAILSAITELLQLPDNVYVYSTVFILKSQKDSVLVRDMINRSHASDSNRLLERLAFIVGG